MKLEQKGEKRGEKLHWKLITSCCVFVHFEGFFFSLKFSFPLFLVWRAYACFDVCFL